jgi:hypothetical protein
MKSTDAEREARWARVHAAQEQARADIDRITGALLESLASDPEEYEGATPCVCGGRLRVTRDPYGGWNAQCSRVGCGSQHDRSVKRAARSAVSQAVNLYRLTH